MNFASQRASHDYTQSMNPGAQNNQSIKQGYMNLKQPKISSAERLSQSRKVSVGGGNKK